MIHFDRYAQLFRFRETASAIPASVIGRLPMGIAPLAILLFVQSGTGSFVRAGTASALYVLGLTVVAPVIGRFIDRFGPRSVLAVSALVYPAALCGLVVLVMVGAHPAWILLCAVTAGAALPPITVCMRALFPRFITDAALLQAAYSLDAALVETMYILGPALVAVMVASGAPGGAVLLAAACAGAGAFIFLRSPAVNHWAPPRASPSRNRFGPLRHSGLLVLFTTTAFYGTAFGLFEVAVTAFATDKGAPAAAGVILALASVGSAAGAVLHGSRTWSLAPGRQLLLSLALMAAGTLLLVPISSIYLFALIGVVAGAPLATILAVQSLLTAGLAPRGMLAESFTWGATCLLGGMGAGFAAGGMLAEHFPPQLILVTAAGSTGLAALVAWAALPAVRSGRWRTAGTMGDER
jgi:MFS family permease